MEGANVSLMYERSMGSHGHTLRKARWLLALPVDDDLENALTFCRPR